ncbi:MAG: selenocysteine-specific translation elongation factor [Oscillochloridaceae bacterium]|nr:selenocysteine-specific translation elongation factor [Chloroflexaceae bacterium]MDW8391932.1 selenocysteine-specific translation elongation factor [Oscillochloridaceae bacterium]
MYVVGTAGHVDHGKSTLVKALTGIDPDRWEEEQRREMTIDLGFAWLTLPSGRAVSLIDVPGHERFIKNMLAGVGGLDAALLVVAADEAVMPQTVEHLAILDLLAVRHGVVVLTKADLVDADWLALVEEEVRARLKDTSLEPAPIVAVSARTGQGLDVLVATLDRVLDATPSRAAATGAPRLPVDRSFTIGGFGTVVTGTLLDGPLRVGQEVVILPAERSARVRGLQIHKQRCETALPGARLAVNLAGVHHREVARGDVLALPGVLRPSTLLDMHVRVLGDAPAPLEQNTALDLFLGAAEVRCRLTLLDAEALAPGSSGWVQLRLERPVVAVRGDRAVLRVASPGRTVAGGVVVDPHPPRHRRFRPEVIAGLEVRLRGDPLELLLQALGDGPPRPWAEVRAETGLLDRRSLAPLLTAGRVLWLGAPPEQPDAVDDGWLVSAAGWAQLEARLLPALRDYHRRYPLRRGMPREEARQKLRLPARALGAVLDEAARRGLAACNETHVWLAGHDPRPSPEQLEAIEAALAAMRRAPYAPPAPALDEELLAWTLERGLIVRLAADVFLLPETYAELLAWVRAAAADGGVSVAMLRDRFGTSRKYAVAFLEHLDERKITRREGEGRVLV